MKKVPGIIKPDLQALPQMRDRLSFLYLEHCVLNRIDGAISVTDMRGTVHVPAAAVGILMLGPGSKVTHRAMELIGDAGTSVLWVGERGVRYYASGRALTHSAGLLIKQAELVTNVRSRVAVARKMYQMRFENEDVSGMTMQQLRGREGARVRGVYRKMSKETGVTWNGREYDPDDFEGGTPVNQALSVGHACLYGLAHSAIAALGCSPGLGFVHNGHERSFVYDIADLYKAEITIPIAFRIAAMAPEDIEGETRRAVRDVFARENTLERIVKDIRWLLNADAEDDPECETLNLWDDKNGFVKNAVSYGKEFDEFEDDNEIDSQEQAQSNGKILENDEEA